jgi:ABC-type microcin C transport system permease subunit YejE
MKKAILSAIAASSLLACTSVESAVVSSAELQTEGDAIAVVQANALGLTALFHVVDIVQSDLDVVVNKLLVAEAKAMGASKIEVMSAHTTPRHGLYALTGAFPFVLIGITESNGTAIAIK